MIISFEKIIQRFISKHGIRAVVLNIKFINNDECEIFLHGGFSTTIKVIEDKLYKDGALFCKVEDLFG